MQAASKRGDDSIVSLLLGRMVQKNLSLDVSGVVRLVGELSKNTAQHIGFFRVVEPH